MKKIDKSWIEAACTAIVITLMICVSGLLGEKEVIFPEIAALSIGSFLAPKLSWRTSYLRMAIFIEACALAGVGIVCFVPVPAWIQVVLAFIIGQLIYMVSATSLAPMISAIVLPVLLQTRSIIYLLAALFLTLLVILLRLGLERAGIKERESQPSEALLVFPAHSEWTVFFFRTSAVIPIAWLCIHSGMKFCMAPPLLVAFTELCKRDCPAGKKRPQTVLLVSACALSGALIRLLILQRLHLPLVIAALSVSLLIILLVKGFGLCFPPAGAMAVLAFLIPDSAVMTYPLQVLAGITCFTVLSYLWCRISKTPSSS